MEGQSCGVRGDSALCLLPYACLTLSKPGLAPLALAALPFMSVPVSASAWCRANRTKTAEVGFITASFHCPIPS